MKKQRVILASAMGGLALLLAGAGLLLNGEKRETETGNTVLLTQDGFVPSALTVQAGEAVTFRSALKRDFWPASNLHPTHTQYPDFDPKKPLAPDEEWSFVFGAPGTWGYHDHLAPSFVGTITVNAAGAASGEAGCEGDRLECWQAELYRVLEQEGVHAAYERLEEMYQEKPSFAESCHSVAHNLGIRAVNLYAENPDLVLSPKTASCANGFYHGFMEGFLGRARDVQEAVEVCAFFGRELSKEAPDAELQCYHGIGHGAIETAIARDLQEDSVQAWIGSGLALCEQASRETEPLYRCASGLFNGIANFAIQGSFGVVPDREDPFWLCHEQPEQYKESCYGNFNSLVLWLAENDFARAITYLELVEEPYAEQAMEYVGRVAALYQAREEPHKALDACKEASAGLGRSCIRGLAFGTLEHGTPGEEWRDALELCALLEGEERRICLQASLSYLPNWYAQDKARAICEGLSAEEREFCQG